VSALIVHIRTIPAPALVTIVGEIDFLTAPELRDHVLAVPDGDLVLDASGVQLLAAAGLRTLLELQDRRALAGARLVLAAAPPPVRRILAVTGYDTSIPMTATVEDAVALITGTPKRKGTRVTRASADGRRGHYQFRAPRSPRSPERGTA
jgi:anti-sigma B factor antagonist